MRITILSSFSFGYIDLLAKKLSEKENVAVEFIDISTIPFRYSSVFHRVKNFFLKTFLKRNLKQEYKMNEIRKVLDRNPHQDFVLVIRPDKFTKPLLNHAASRTDKIISYYFDAIDNIPEKLEFLPCFDEVYSYEKSDVEKYGLKFITNFIPLDEVAVDGKTAGIFNISSHDPRTTVLEKIAQKLEKYQYPYKFIVKTEKPVDFKFVQVISENMDVLEVKKQMENSAILLDIQKENQQGLSFRVFEALGYDKKLITTNKDVVTYDFYNPANILVIDKENPDIPEEFLTRLHIPVPEEIKSRYRRDSWIKKVFDVD